MPNNMDDLFDFDAGESRNLDEREDRCLKAIKIVSKAIAMRLVICGLLVWVTLSRDLPLWAAGMILLVLVINLTGMFPLLAELKKRRSEWKLLLEEE